MIDKTRTSIAVYLALTFAGSAIFYAQAIRGTPVGQISALLMWMPGLAAIVTQSLFYRTLEGLGWGFGSWRYTLPALLIPPAYCLVIYVPVWLSGLGRLDPAALGASLPVLPVLIVFGLITALGEEIGWRGFLAPAFERAGGFAWAGIATGLIWGLWHLPLLIWGGYNAGTPAWFGFGCFLVTTTGISVMLAWLRLRSGSVWPAALYHAAHNATIQGVFDASTVDTGPTPWITTEFGVGLALVAVALAVYFWRRRGELQQPRASKQRYEPLPPFKRPERRVDNS